jgi:membrane protein DedA with SNARE-associated domain
LKSITLAITKFGLKLSALLMPLGAWGVFAIAALDGLGVPLPGALDIAFATYVHNKPFYAPFYVLVAAVGSTLGCLVLYFIGFEGGEMLLRKRMSPEKFERTRLSFENHRLLALMLPAMLPPPFPFKIFVLSAAVFEMEVKHFLVAIFMGRLIRFTGAALIILYLGPEIAGFFRDAFKHHFGLVLLAAAVLVGLWFLLRRLHAQRCPATNS